jgi:protocatechuate 3,4-dioxygenase beta subunit
MIPPTRRSEETMDTKRVGRREALAAMTAAGLAVALGCDDGPTNPTEITPGGGASTGSTNGLCAVTPTEALGPYPSLSSLYRRDIRENREGTPLTLTIKVVNVNSACGPVRAADVSVWHADAFGDYSEYGASRSDTFLRGIQTTGSSGEVTFLTFYPGWIIGRATHVHVQVMREGSLLKVTQMAFPEAISNLVHRQGPYAARGPNPVANAADAAFADTLAAELVLPAGDLVNGYAATFQVTVAI